MAMTVTLVNETWDKGVNVEVRMGPDVGGTPPDNYEARNRRMNHGAEWAIEVADGFDLWYRRDWDPDHPTVPPSYRNIWNHINNFGSDVREPID